MENVERWTSHSLMSDPLRHAATIADLPSDIGVLNDTIQGVLVHSDWLIHYGLDEARLHTVSRTTLPIADRLDEILGEDAQPLQIRRPPDKRAVGTCRDFALMLCSFLRSKSIPSRVRCGFANYLSDLWEDHWVCEYWDEEVQTWHLSDSQIDGMLKERLGIEFRSQGCPARMLCDGGTGLVGLSQRKV